MTRELDFVDECYKDKDLSLLKKLTLVIPTYNRNYYLSRCLWYHAHFPFGQIIVADSSLDEKKEVNREIITKIRERFGANILYLEYQPEKEEYGGDIYRKWGNAVQHVEMEYSKICTDKEFVLPTQCCESIKFLTKNQDYIGAAGRRVNYFNDYFLSSICSVIPMKSYEQDTPQDRLSAFAASHIFYENLFRIYRRSDIKFIYRNLLTAGINDFRYGEISLELQPFILGKTKEFKNIERLRDISQVESGFRKRIINLKESSSLCYPYPAEYPQEMRNICQDSLNKSLTTILPEDSEKSIIEKIKSDAQIIINWWMIRPYQTKSSPKTQISMLMIHHFPKFAAILSKYIGDGSFAQYWKKSLPINQQDPTLKVIKKVILSTNKSHNSDEIIKYTLRFEQK